MKWKIVFTTVIFIAAAVSAFVLWRPVKPQHVQVSDSLHDVLGDIEPVLEPDGGPEHGTPAAGEEEKPVAEEKPVTRTIPSRAMIDVPFVVQAPFANWDLPYKEACEEASVLMVNRFYRGETSLTEEQMKAGIDDLAAWSEQRFSGRVDTTAQETALFFTEYLEYDADRVALLENPTAEDLKAVVAAGFPVIVPAAGRELGNKNFRTPGPLYHMLVIVGYDEDEFITNDPGTHNGEGYRYKQQVLVNAIHDLTPDLEQITAGKPVVLIIKK